MRTVHAEPQQGEQRNRIPLWNSAAVTHHSLLNIFYILTFTLAWINAYIHTNAWAECES